MLNDILLSKNARLGLESSYIPTITGFFVNIRIVTSTQDINVDASKYNSGNPILFATKSNITITNNSELFYSINVPENFLSRGYIEIEVESPVVTANVDYITGAPMKPFFISFIIIDEEEEEVHNQNMAPKSIINFLVE